MTERLRRHGRVLVVALVGVAVLAACGSSSSKTTSTTSAGATGTTAASGSATTAAAPTGTPLLIGVTSEIGAASGDYTTSVAAARAAVVAINAAGGVGGHPLKIDFCDNGFDANKSAACARQFVADGVVAQSASTAPFGEDGITAVLQAAGIPQVGDNALAQWIAAPNEFPVAQYLPGVYADVPACEMLNLKTVSITGTDNSFGVGFAKILRTVATKLPDVKVVSGSDRVIVPATATDVSSQVQQVLGSKANCIDMSGVFPQQEILFLQGMKTFNADPASTKAIWGVAGASTKDLQGAAPLVKDYLIGVQMFPPLAERTKFKGLQQYVDEINAAKASGVTGTPNVTGDVAQRDLDIQAWLGIHALAKVMQQEQAYTAKDIMAALLRVTNVDLGDLVPGGWTPTAKGETAFPRLPMSLYYVVEYNDKTEPHLAIPTPIDIRQYLP